MALLPLPSLTLLARPYAALISSNLHPSLNFSCPLRTSENSALILTFCSTAPFSCPKTKTRTDQVNARFRSLLILGYLIFSLSRPLPSISEPGSIPCKIPVSLASAEREPWFPSRTASTSSWFLLAFEWLLRHPLRLQPAWLCSPCIASVRS